MSRYSITVLVIAAIIFVADSAGAAPPEEPKELTVLAYNTHLWYDSAAHYMCDLCNDFLLHLYPCCDPGDFLFEDEIRREYIVAYVVVSEADIVVLQEVWAPSWQEWFAEQLYPHGYEYAYFVDSSCDSYFYGKDTLSNGLVLLSKLPLSGARFREFPTYFPSCFMWEFCEEWANKGVSTADVNVGGVTIRVGVSHAIGEVNHEKGFWSYMWAYPITPFQLNGETYIFALKKDNTGRIVRMEDYGRSRDEKEEKYNYGAGWKLLYAGLWGSDYRNVTSFELDGHPYLFAGSNTARRAYIFRINDDPSTGWTQMYVGVWDVNTPHSVNTGLAAWYRFQNNAYDSSFPRYDGTPYGKPTYSSDCKEDTRSINLDGENDYVYVGDVGIDGNSPRTIAGWVRATKPAADIPGWAGIFGFTSTEGADTHFDIQRNGGSDNYCIHVNGWEQNIAPLDQEWHHLAATYDGSTIAWYADGSRVGSAARILNTYDHVQIGKRADKNAFFPGLVDDVRIYSRALSQDEIGYLAGLGYITVKSFELDGHPYLFGLKTGNEADIFRINDDPCMGWENIYSGIMGSDYVAVTSFELEGHPYLFGIHETAGAYIRRINDDPCTGWTVIYGGPMSSDYVHVTSFELDGHPYVFALRNTTPTLASILRINDDPCTGWTEKFSDYWDPNEFPYIAVQSFEMNGHPYLFAKRHCCEQMQCEFVPYVPVPLYPSRCHPCQHSLLGEAYLKRINDDPNKGWENLNQLEEIKIIRDRTVVDEDGPPAIMMGDFNVHQDKYGIMNELFGKAGAVDAYIEVHGTDAGGETGDLSNNKLAQRLCPGDPSECDPNNHPPDRVDYVYVRQSGAGLRLVPTEAYVIRDWKYYSPNAGDFWDLSDHFPLFVKFEIFEGGCTARMKGDLNCDRLINFADFAILASAWMSGPNDISWDPACDISEPADDFIDTKDVDIFAQAWLTTPVHNVTQDKWYEYIQAAIDDANDGDEIEVAPGAYYESINFNGKAIRLYSSGGPEVTTIDPSGIGGAYHVVQCKRGEDANTILEGFTITGGNANGPTTADTHGGGMYNYNSSPTVINCNFTGNSATSGGGMYNTGSSPTIINCSFSGNNTTGNGGGMFNHGGNIKVANCTFSGNSAGGVGGAMRNYDSSPTVTNCTFSGNTASSGGGMYNTRSSNLKVTNCILWGNSPDEIYNETPIPNVTYSDVKGGTGQSWFGAGCIDAPCLVDAGGGDLRIISSTSPCVDAGDNNSVPGDTTDIDGDANTTEPIPWDLCGNPRIWDGDESGTAVVDMGALEFNGGPIRNLMRNSTYMTIQAAIDDANDDDEIKVAPGTYKEAINFNGKAVWLYSSGGPEVTTIDGTGNYHVVQCVSLEDANTILDGFTITGGNATGGWPDYYGGGMYNQQSSPTVTNCIFTGNSAGSGGGMYNNNNSSPTVTDCNFTGNSAGSGGGMYNYENSSPTVTDCTFNANQAAGKGGGMYNDSSSPTVTDCNFTGNTAGTYGGGMMNNNSSPQITSCIFSDNTAAGYGGGMYNDASLPLVANCVFNQNIATQSHGGGIANYNSSHSTVTNCTFTLNDAGGDGDGMRNWDSSPIVTNCIFWNNRPLEISSAGAGSPNVTYCDVEGGTGQSWFGTGCIDADPCFVDANAGDLRLSTPNSPCVDAGDNDALPADTADLDGDGDTTEPIPFDLDGGPRVWNGIVDMGAYEYLPSPPATAAVDFKDVALICAKWLAGTEPEL